MMTAPANLSLGADQTIRPLTPHVIAELNYYRPSSTRPVSYTFEPPEGVPWESGDYDMHKMAIHDARQLATRPRLQVEGFELWDASTEVSDFSDRASIEDVYYREARQLALAVTGAKQAYVFDHLLRRRAPRDNPLDFGKRGANGYAAANGRIHNDYTEESGQRRLALVIEDLHQREQITRFSIINMWRALNGPVQDAPLAICDARTVSSKELFHCDVRYPNRTGGIYLLQHCPQHRWFYYPTMRKEEVLIFKQYDSLHTTTSRFTPHSAFDLPAVPPDTPPRESIELRCLVTY